MTSPPIHKSFGTPLDEWVASFPYELETDLAGL